MTALQSKHGRAYFAGPWGAICSSAVLRTYSVRLLQCSPHTLQGNNMGRTGTVG